MEHLSVEALSRLVDEPSTPEERGHLERCAPCREELQALRQQTSALRALPDLRPPVGDWEVIQARLVSEGLVKRPGGVAARLAVTPIWMRAAAAVLLFVTGAASGMGVARTRWAAAAPADLASATTVEDAARLVRDAEERYMEALLHHNQLVVAQGGGGEYADPATRFAALDYLVDAGRAALRQAPADPFLNGFVMSLMTERQAQLRRISSGPDNWF